MKERQADRTGVTTQSETALAAIGEPSTDICSSTVGTPGSGAVLSAFARRRFKDKPTSASSPDLLCTKGYTSVVKKLSNDV